MRALLPILILLVAVGHTAASPFSWVRDAGKALELKDAHNDTLVRFQLDPQPADPHFDVIKRANGGNLLWVGPDDHPWHYGHWFSWKFINGVNFWETNRETGRSDGLAEVSEPGIRIEGDTARISYTHHYRTGAGDKPVLKDDFTIEIQAPGSEDAVIGPVVDWSIVTTALADVTLDRTPLPNEPGGKSYGGYGGLSWRGASTLDDVLFTDSEGRKGMDVHRQRAKWVNAVGTLNDKPVGITVMAPTADSEPMRSWYLAGAEKLPFWFINPAILQPKPLVLKRGESFTHRYRLVVHDGSWSPVSE